MAITYGNNFKNKRQLVSKATRKYSDDEINQYIRKNKEFLTKNNFNIVKNPRSASGWEIRKNGRKISEVLTDIGKGYYKNDTNIDRPGIKVTTPRGKTYKTSKYHQQLVDPETGKLVSTQSVVQQGTPAEQLETYKAVVKAQSSPRVRDFTNRVKTNSNTSTNSAQKHYQTQSKNGSIKSVKTKTGGYADRTRNSNTGRVATWNQPSASALNNLNKPNDNSYYNAKDLNANINRGTFRNSQLKEQGVSFKDAWKMARAAGALQFRYGNGMYNTRSAGESEANWIANANRLYDKNLVSNQDNQYIAANAVRNADGTVTRSDIVASYGNGRGQYNDNQYIGGYDNRQLSESFAPGTQGELRQTGKVARFGYSSSPQSQDRLIGRDVATYEGILSSQIRDLPYLEKNDNLLPEVVVKHQDGGQMQQQQLMQQIARLIQQGGPEQAVQALMSQGASQEQATQLVQQVMQAMGGTPSARQGAKLNYLKSLQGICAADEYLTYFKAGGSICPVCAKKKQIQEAKCGKKLQKGGGVSKAVDTIKSQLRSKR